MRRFRQGFSLAELVIVILIIGTLAFIAIPRINFSAITVHKTQAEANILATNLRKTRMLAINNAAKNPDGYALRMNGSGQYYSYEIVNLSSDQIVASHIINQEVKVQGPQKFDFSGLGNLTNNINRPVRISNGNRQYHVNVIPATGMVKIEEK